MRTFCPKQIIYPSCVSGLKKIKVSQIEFLNGHLANCQKARVLRFWKKIQCKSLGSVLSIGGIYPPFWDWQIFWTLTAIFSIILAFMNILPIPGLDGGHALFTLVEMVTGRKPSDKFLEYSQMVGMVLLMGLMAYALGLDVWRIFK